VIERFIYTLFILFLLRERRAKLPHFEPGAQLTDCANWNVGQLKGNAPAVGERIRDRFQLVK
jgi:hypothetical protein